MTQKTGSPCAWMVEWDAKIAAEVGARTEAWQRPPRKGLPSGQGMTALCPHCNERRVVFFRTTGDAFWPLGQAGEPSVPCSRCEPKLAEQLANWEPKVGGAILVAGVRDPWGPVPLYCVLGRDGDRLTVRRLDFPDFPPFDMHVRDAYPRHLGISSVY